ncbi:MAG: hypothetical protein R2744_03235 [Bacteroidales bacterium]
MEDNVNAYSTAVDVIDNGPYSLVSRSDYVDSWSLASGSSESIFAILNNAADNTGLESVSLSDPEGCGRLCSRALLITAESDPG